MASDIDDLASSILVTNESENNQPGPSIAQSNQRASVIVAQSASNENRIETNDVEVTIQTHSDQESRDSASEVLANSPVFRRRRPRGMNFSKSFFCVLIDVLFWISLFVGEDDDDVGNEDSGPPARKLKSEAAGGFLANEEKPSGDDEEDGQVSVFAFSFFAISFRFNFLCL